MQRRAGFLRPDGNVLRRLPDRVEWAIMAGLLAFLMLAAPGAAIAAGSAADHAVLGQVRAERSWHQVTATLTRPGTQRLESAAGNSAVLSARATWTAAGRTHAGWVPVLPSGPKTRTAKVWVNAAGAHRAAVGQGQPAPGGRAGGAVRGADRGLPVRAGCGGHPVPGESAADTRLGDGVAGRRACSRLPDLTVPAALT